MYESQEELNKLLNKFENLPPIQTIKLMPKIDTLIKSKKEQGIELSLSENLYLKKQQLDSKKLNSSDSLSVPITLWFLGSIGFTWFSIYGLHTKGFSHHEAVIYLTLLSISFTFFITSIGLYYQKQWAKYPALFCSAIAIVSVPIGTYTSYVVFNHFKRQKALNNVG